MPARRTDPNLFEKVAHPSAPPATRSRASRRERRTCYWHSLAPATMRQSPHRLPGRRGSVDSGISGAAQAENRPSPLAIARNWFPGWFWQPWMSLFVRARLAVRGPGRAPAAGVARLAHGHVVASLGLRIVFPAGEAEEAAEAHALAVAVHVDHLRPRIERLAPTRAHLDLDGDAVERGRGREAGHPWGKRGGRRRRRRRCRERDRRRRGAARGRRRSASAVCERQGRGPPQHDPQGSRQQVQGGSSRLRTRHGSPCFHHRPRRDRARRPDAAGTAEDARTAMLGARTTSPSSN